MRPAGNKERKFIPGSDWLYVKLYGTPASANILLEKVIFPVIAKHRRRIRTWFFIRYADPGTHLRVRIRIKGSDAGQLLAAIKGQLAKTKTLDLVSNFCCDTYYRELERYGVNYIDQAEAVFAAGSELLAGWIGAKDVVGTSFAEFRLGLRTAQQMIATFYPDRPAAIAFTGEMTESYLAEFTADKKLRVDLDAKYRSLQAEIQQALTVNETFAGSVRGTILTAELEILAAQLPFNDETARRRMLADLVHMQLNRTFVQSQRQQELLVYYCLHKYLVSAHARAKKGAQAG